jgi:hypothetical protein
MAGKKRGHDADTTMQVGIWRTLGPVMAGLDPAIHVLIFRKATRRGSRA